MSYEVRTEVYKNMILTVGSCACSSLGHDPGERYLHVAPSLRDCLRLFKGCRLSVLMALALQSDEEGMVSVDRDMLSAETGYNKVTVMYTIADLCRLTINNHRVLVPCAQGTVNDASRYSSFLLFPGNREED